MNTQPLVILETSIRKPRVTKAVVKEFVKWAFNNNLYDTCTPGRMRQLYKAERGIDIGESCIRQQRYRWQMVNGELTRVLD